MMHSPSLFLVHARALRCLGFSLLRFFFLHERKWIRIYEPCEETDEFRWLSVSLWAWKGMRKKGRERENHFPLVRFKVSYLFITHSLRHQIYSKYDLFSHLFPLLYLSIVISLSLFRVRSSSFLGVSSKYCLFEKYITQLLSIAAKGRTWLSNWSTSFLSFLSLPSFVVSVLFSCARLLKRLAPLIDKRGKASTMSASVQSSACCMSWHAGICLYMCVCVCESQRLHFCDNAYCYYPCW